MPRILNKAAEVGEGDEGLIIGPRVEKGEIPEVKLQANKDSKADKWELAICEARKGVGKLATVWGGEVVGMRVYSRHRKTEKF